MFGQIRSHILTVYTTTLVRHETPHKTSLKGSFNSPSNRHIATSNQHRTIIWFLYQRNSFPTYKIIQDHLHHSRKFYIKNGRQYHQRNPHSHQHLQGKMLQHNFYHKDNEFNINYLRYHISTESLNICAKGQ